ncbi:AI-2E family transporter [Accumulibacter sp.]|uniref:AI-2E family transporter n=1 Tax=Accumulibacter sp. TaxID=2053492 RepID=UPI002625D646|nr:AI-2E family transporter [Accumulibacter sp.]
MNASTKISASDYASWILSGLALLLVLHVRLLPAVIAGLLVYQVVHLLAPWLAQHISGLRARVLAVGMIVLLVVGVAVGCVFAILAVMDSEGGSFAALLSKMAEILDTSRAALPGWLADLLPTDASALRERFSQWLREHSSELQMIGKETGRGLAHILVGMVIGGMISLNQQSGESVSGPLADALSERVFRLSEAFRRVVFAQVRISALNTVFTGLYLLLVLPLFGVHLPLTKTMIVLTFFAGLLPVVGNLISNTVIFVISLAHSPGVAAASLVYLVLIHKLEYFLNARIVGSQINAKAWELLTAMLLMESVFGLSGLVAAPICYAWLKDELHSLRLI